MSLAEHNRSTLPRSPDIDVRRPQAVMSISVEVDRQTQTCDISSDGDDSSWTSDQDVELMRLSPGQIVPGTRFRITRWLGEGGMGLVFEAVHVDIERRVALKVLKSSLGINPDRRASFLAEARACARIQSRFVVDVLDFGVLPDERPFFAMELLGQDTVCSEIAKHPLPLERALPILRQICKGLAAIHETGLVHRDLKPRNVILQTEEGRSDAVRIVDFGIATQCGPQPRILGSPSCMAPEQIQGRDCDGRLDIYALGCMSYWMLSGRPLFEGDVPSVLRAHVDQPPPPITQRCPDLPAQLDAILLRCLAKNSEDRWPNCHELEAALCEVQISMGFTTMWDDLPMPEVDAARRQSLIRQMPRTAAFTRARMRGLFAAGIVTALIVAIGLAFGGRREGQQTSERNDAAALVTQNRIAELTDAIRVAGSRAYWVYPPLDNPNEPTALYWITELEALPGPLEVEASARAWSLRVEIAETLTRLGDKYWDKDNGRSFALEYYALALIFNPDQDRASMRSSLSMAQRADMTARAVRGEFTPSELRAGEIMAALADPNPEQLYTRVAALIGDEAFSLSLQTREHLIAVSKQPSPSQAPNLAGVDEAPEDGDEVVRDSAKAKASVERARAALARGDRAKAKQSFNQAIAYDNRSVVALAGLAELQFDAGEYGDALRHARLAARLRPSDAELQVLVGDCYLKGLLHTQARAAYQRAAELGHPRANQRLEYLAELGG